jgi:outer membrane receptor protein involved in Fe transport
MSKIKGRAGGLLLGLLLTTAGYASDISSTSLPARGEAGSAQRIDFKIDAPKLSRALIQLTEQSGLQLIYPAGGKVIDLPAKPLSGQYTPEAALKELLKDSGLEYEFLDAHTISIVDPNAKTAATTSLAQGESVPDGDGSLRLAQNAGTPNTGATGLQDENSSSDDSDENSNDKLQEIIVTAQRREERLIDVPQSVSVLAVEALAKSGITQFRDFADLVPGLSLTTYGAGYNQISIRGVTSGLDVSPTVGIYVDDVPYGSTTALASSAQLALDVGLFDMDRIEVLRGPQGTLYGASSMGGLIKYVTRRPDPTSTAVEMQAGLASSQDGDVTYNGAAAVNMPIATDVAAVRASAFYSHDGGYIDNIRLGEKDVNQSNVYGGRLDFLLKPSEPLTIRIGGYLQNIDRDGTAFADYRYALPSGPSEGRPATDSLEQSRLVQEPFEQEFRLVNGTLSYDLDWAELTSITSYQTARTNFVADVSGPYVPYVNGFLGGNYSAISLPNFSKTDKFAQEVRLVSQGDNTLDWIVGGFYTRETADYQQALITYDLAGQSVPNDLYTQVGPSRYSEYAAFGDLTWHLSKSFDVTGGLRYSQNKQRYLLVQTGILAGAFDRANSSDEDVVTYLANARYKLGDRSTLYVRYATGYRPGGPNAVGFDLITGDPLGPPAFDADRLKSYEAGFRAETADRRFGIELAGYLIDWDNFQVLTQRNTFSVRINAAQGAEIKGVELNLTARPMTGMTFTGAFAYQDAGLAENDVDLGGVKGERLPNVPEFTAALNGDYSFQAGSLPVNVGATVRYVGDRQSSFSASVIRSYELPDYVSVDLRAGVTLGRVSLQIYGRNIFDQRGQLSAYTAYGIPYVATSQPRTIGLTATTRF